MKKTELLIAAAIVMLLAGGCILRPNPEDTKLIAAEVERRIAEQAWPTQSEITTPSPSLPILEPADETLTETPTPTEEPKPKPQETAPLIKSPAPTLAPLPVYMDTDSESIVSSNEEAELTKEPIFPTASTPPAYTLPAIVAPIFPEPTLPSATFPVEPPSMPGSSPTPSPIPNPTITSEPVSSPEPSPEPTSEPTEQPIPPIAEPTVEPAQTGYAECSCGAMLNPDELAGHMKAHAMNGEGHSYRAY